MTKARRGIYAAAVSPFNEDGSMNVEKSIAYCKYLLSEGGCDGVAPTGTTGEGNSIPMTSRLALPGAFAKAGIESDRVLFGTGSPSSGDCRYLQERHTRSADSVQSRGRRCSPRPCDFVVALQETPSG